MKFDEKPCGTQVTNWAAKPLDFVSFLLHTTWQDLHLKFHFFLFPISAPHLEKSSLKLSTQLSTFALISQKRKLKIYAKLLLDFFVARGACTTLHFSAKSKSEKFLRKNHEQNKYLTLSTIISWWRHLRLSVRKNELQSSINSSICRKNLSSRCAPVEDIRFAVWLFFHDLVGSLSWLCCKWG